MCAMIEQIRERVLGSVKRVSRELGLFGFGSRLLLTTILATSCSPGAQASGQEKPKCPSTAVEVSYLVGGDPQNWTEMPQHKGGWIFTSQEEQMLNGARIGRIDTPNEGRLALLIRLRASRAWYVCPGRELTPDNLQPLPTPQG